jgi:uncharacterized alkaline shock family protein YloU
MLAIAGAVIAISLGWSYPLTYLNAVAFTPTSNLIMGTSGIVLAVIAFIMLMWGLKTSPDIASIVVEKGIAGEVSISIAATKAIIMKAVRQVEGVKELRPTVNSTPTGLTVKLHAMLNPDHNVPETAQLLQCAVRENLEKTGGLQVADIKVLVDDFNPGSSR